MSGRLDLRLWPAHNRTEEGEVRGRVEEVLCLLKSASSYSCYNEGHFDVCLDLKLACFLFDV